MFYTKIVSALFTNEIFENRTGACYIAWFLVMSEPVLFNVGSHQIIKLNEVSLTCNSNQQTKENEFYSS